MVTFPDCPVCTDSFTVEEILRLVTVCDLEGSVAFRIKVVPNFAFTEDCPSCEQYLTSEDFLRKSIWCNAEGKWYIRAITIT